ncbi:hypothetical protein D3C78_1294270 [compost metagenome]
MSSNWTRSLKLSLCAAAVCALGAVGAQTMPPASSAEPSPAPAAQPSTPSAAPQAKPQESKKSPQKTRKSGQRGKYATPQAHEAAAVRAEERAGRMPRGETMDQYQRNAQARCEAFREPEDRNSCVERVRSAAVSGSVQGGGVLRELTEEVPVKPEAAPQPAS